MKTAIFMCPFDMETRQTAFPELEEGQILDWVHLEPEQDSKVKVQITGPDEVIETMKSDGRFTWIEDIIDQD